LSSVPFSLDNTGLLKGYFEKTPDGIPRFPVVIDWGIGERND